MSSAGGGAPDAVESLTCCEKKVFRVYFVLPRRVGSCKGVWMAEQRMYNLSAATDMVRTL